MEAIRKFTDRDLRDNEDLIDIAKDYLRDYTGDFKFLVDADALLLSTGTLPVPVARGVLNCMRVDPKAQDRLPDVVKYHRSPPRLKVAPYRPAYVHLKSRFKKTYLLSTAKNASVAHLIRQEWGGVIWFPHIEEYRFDVRLWCGKSLRAGALHTDDTQGRDICAQCLRNKEMYGD